MFERGRTSGEDMELKFEYLNFFVKDKDIIYEDHIFSY